MAQFDVFRNDNQATREETPYLLDVQSDLLDPLATRVVVPLVKASAIPTPIRYLNPVFELEGETVVMSTAELAGIPRRSLGARVGSFSGRRDDIIRALDVLIAGL